jgi:hypothetical protein
VISLQEEGGIEADAVESMRIGGRLVLVYDGWVEVGDGLG